MEGWIKLHRKLKDHWIWKSDNRLKWWIDILMTVNHDDAKVLIKGTLIECKRGQSIRSLDSWGRDWNVTKGAVRDFFRLLQNDSMLHTESLQITTRITVCNYEDYQTELHTEETQKKRNTNAKETQALHKQEGKEGLTMIKNEKEESEIEKVFNIWLEYKKERRESYKSEMSKKACLKNLIKLSSNDCIKARKIIDQSIANNYAGIFELRPEKTNGAERSDTVTLPNHFS